MVEDEENFREVIRTTLEEHGYRVVAAHGGVSAVEILQVCSGWPNVTVIYMFGHTDEALAPYGVARSQSHLLAKPFTPHSLLRAVRVALDAAPRRATR